MMSDLTLRHIYKAGDIAARAWFEDARWGGDIACPKCDKAQFYKLDARNKFKCANRKCFHQYSVFSGTPFGNTKLAPTDLLALLYLFTSGAVGVSSLQLSRMAGVSQNAAWLICHKIRQAILDEMNGLVLDGTVEIDGGHFGGHRRYWNSAPTREPGSPPKVRRCFQKNGNKRVLIVAHQRMGRTVIFSGTKEADAIPGILNQVSEHSVIVADGARAWDSLQSVFDMLRIHHNKSFSANGACTNNAESYFSQFRRMHRGTHRHMSGDLMIAYAAEMAWRLDMREMTHKERVLQLAKTVLKAKKADRWNGYFQKHNLAASAEAA